MLPGGGWSQYPGGPAEVSVSCLSYFALKVAGEPATAPHMLRAREAIVALGGVARANTYTKYHLAFFGQFRWRDLPAIPPEMIFLPSRSPFSVYDMSSWSRAIFIPLSILWARKPVRPLPFACGVDELWVGEESQRPQRPARRSLGSPVRYDRRRAQTYRAGAVLRRLREVAVQKAAAWMLERLQDSDGLGAILPAMASSVLALATLGHVESDPLMRDALRALDGLLLRDEACGTTRVQPCLSPVWDTCSPRTRWRSPACRPTTAAWRERRRGCSASRRGAPATGGAQPRAAGRLVLRVPQRVLSRRRRHLHGADGPAARAARATEPRSAAAIAAGPELDARHAEPRRRLGQLRQRQRQGLV